MPWTTEVVEEGGKLLDKFVKGTGGEPGWKVTCESTLGLEATDTCTTAEGNLEHAFLENQVVGGILLVLGESAKRSKQSCTLGGKETGEMEGKAAGLLAKGMALSARSF